jgi:hypothetical protein
MITYDFSWKLPKLIVVRLEGGLGNQLFQYSYAIALQAKHGGRLVLDRRLIRGDPSKADALEQVANVQPTRFTDPMLSFFLRSYAGAVIRIIRSLRGSTDAAARIMARLGVHHPLNSRHVDLDVGRLPFQFLHGNFMSEKYFAVAADQVRALIHPERALRRRGHDLLARITSTNSIAVHVRRGDYLSDQWRDKLHVCTDGYYERAIQIIREEVNDPTFFVFSNSLEDAEWIRENYRFLSDDTVFVQPGASDTEHFALMVACRHFIIANSTFSWWSSYLSTNPDKVIVAPSPWNRNVWDMTDLYNPDWKLVDLNLAGC